MTTVVPGAATPVPLQQEIQTQSKTTQPRYKISPAYLSKIGFAGNEVTRNTVRLIVIEFLDKTNWAKLNQTEIINDHRFIYVKVDLHDKTKISELGMYSPVYNKIKELEVACIAIGETILAHTPTFIPMPESSYDNMIKKLVPLLKA